VSDPGDSIKLTAYFGERARAGGGFLADALVDIAARHRLETSLVMRGIEGFGAKHARRTDRLLSLSEDLPMVAVAVDRRAKVEPALDDLRELPSFSGLVTMERARMLDPEELTAGAITVDGEAKLTIYVGRQERAAGRPAHVAIVDLLHRRGIAGATVLLGIDGTRRGERRRARFWARNAEVPLMVIAVADGDRIAAVLGELGSLLADPLVTLERVQVCKRDGVLVQRPLAPGAGYGTAWQKVMVYASSQAHHDGATLHRALLAELQRSGAPGATTLRGVLGFHGDHAPHGDRLWQLHRHVPVLTTLLDRPEAMQAWFDVVDRVTARTGLVTCETVPVLEAAGVVVGEA
jgi:PII-like signaling protein